MEIGDIMAARDPVCGKDVDELRARAVGIWGGRVFYFCSAEHKAEFMRDPARLSAAGVAGAGTPASGVPTEIRREVSSKSRRTPVRGSATDETRAPPPAPPPAPAPSITVTSTQLERPDATPLPPPAPAPSDLAEQTGVVGATSGRGPWLWIVIGVIVLALAAIGVLVLRR
jgi:YHS domain-containing protein